MHSRASARDLDSTQPIDFTYLSVREEELWAGDGSLFAAALTLHGDGI